jgi:hypothetical protein
VSAPLIDPKDVERLEASLLAAFRKAVDEHKASLPPPHPGTPGPDPWDTQTWDERVRATVLPVAQRILAEIQAKVLAAVPAALAGFGAAAILAGIQGILGTVVDSVLSAADSIGDSIGVEIATAVSTATDSAALARSLEGIFAGADGQGILISRLIGQYSNAVSQAVVLGDSTSIGGQYVGGTKTWNTMEDDVVRPEHAAIDGVTVGVDVYFDVGGESAAYPGDPDLSDAMAANCVAPWVPVSGLQTAAMESRWQGDLVYVVTAGGQELAATPDHPVLTRLGWLAIGSLQPGDDVLCTAEVRSVARTSPDVADGHPTAQEALTAVSVAAGMPKRVGRLVVDFYGDEVPYRYVDVHGPHRPLALGLYAEQLEELGHLMVPVAHGEVRVADHPSALIRALHPDKGSLVARAAEHSEVSQTGHDDVAPDAEICGHGLDGPLFVIETPDLGEEVGAAIFRRSADGQPCVSETGSDHRLPNPEVAAETGDTLTSLVAGYDVRSDGVPLVSPVTPDGFAFHAVTSITRLPYSGNVVDITTPAGLYSAGGIVVHNCRCYLTYDSGPPVVLPGS